MNAWRRRHPYDLKGEDAELALRRLAAATPPLPDTAAWRDEGWRTSFVRYWTAAFHPDTAADRIPFLALLQHQQLYDPGFPARWRRRVLAAIAEHSTPDAPDLEQRALRTAARHGLEAAALGAQQLAFWLTTKEVRSLPGPERLLRIMVRSARLDGAWDVWPATRAEAGALLNAALATPDAVAIAFGCNAAAEADDPQHTVGHLRADRIGRHLLDRWGLPLDSDRAVRDAAARDRAFRDFRGAVEVARAFYLGARSADARTPAPTALPSGRDRART
ncbi:hypothetical protein ACFU99_17815 [Streptomyces sp. NPDC057654]|uniref:hypothetical protein n=1 Tax=Streptomyces sp. NPDC057654 TaxID=3346196 RepID=UPI0036A00898